MFDVTAKCALVTSASGGIGADIARSLHGAGATVGLSGTRVAPLEADLGSRAHVLPCNLPLSYKAAPNIRKYTKAFCV